MEIVTIGAPPGYDDIVHGDHSAESSYQGLLRGLRTGLTRRSFTSEHPRAGCLPVEAFTCRDRNDEAFLTLWRWSGHGPDDKDDDFGNDDFDILAICRPHQLLSTLNSTPCA